MNEFLAPVAIVFAKSGAASFSGKQTGTATPADGTATRIKTGARLSWQAIWTGTLTGTFTWEASNNSTDGVNGTWTPMTVTLQGTQPAGAAGSLMVDPMIVGAAWVRPKWTAVSGAGNISIYLVGKGDN